MQSKIDKSGYVLIYKPKHPFARKDGYIAEHRLVMEKKIGRCLDKSELIHHKNEIKNDNRISNLQIMSVAMHRSHHTKNEKNPMFGKNHTDEVKETISQKNKGKRIGLKHSEESKRKMSEGMKRHYQENGKPFGSKNPMFGRKRTEEEKLLISIRTKEGMRKSEKWRNRYAN